MVVPASPAWPTPWDRQRSLSGTVVTFAMSAASLMQATNAATALMNSHLSIFLSDISRF
jgi:hypothetical protein